MVSALKGVEIFPSIMSPGQVFTKTWTIRNTGTSTWNTGANGSGGYTLNFVSGSDRLGAANTYLALPNAVPPNGEVTFSVSLTAPSTPGTYTGQWRLNSANSVDFGPTVSVKIEVRVTTTELVNGTPIANISGAAGSQRFYKITVPSGQPRLEIRISGGTGDCDLYVKHGSIPTLSNWNYRPYKNGNNESVSVENPASGDWYIMIDGYSSFSGVTLIAEHAFTIFVGIHGASAKLQIFEGFPNSPKTWGDSEIKVELAKHQLGNSNADKSADLEAIAGNNALGGLYSMGFYVWSKQPSRSLISEPGNSSVARRDIQSYFNSHKGARIFVVGFSAGGGDVQNLLLALKDLSIPVDLAGFLDSVEHEGDENEIVPNNTRRVMAFYQNGTARQLTDFLGLNVTIQYNYKAEDSSKTIISNELIDNPKPQGPDKPEDDSFAYHRNMDNDKRGWGPLLNYIKSRIPQ